MENKTTNKTTDEAREAAGEITFRAVLAAQLDALKAPRRRAPKPIACVRGCGNVTSNRGPAICEACRTAALRAIDAELDAFAAFNADKADRPANVGAVTYRCRDCGKVWRTTTINPCCPACESDEKEEV